MIICAFKWFAAAIIVIAIFAAFIAVVALLAGIAVYVTENLDDWIAKAATKIKKESVNAFDVRSKIDTFGGYVAAGILVLMMIFFGYVLSADIVKQIWGCDDCLPEHFQQSCEAEKNDEKEAVECLSPLKECL